MKEVTLNHRGPGHVVPYIQWGRLSKGHHESLEIGLFWNNPFIWLWRSQRPHGGMLWALLQSVSGMSALQRHGEE